MIVVTGFITNESGMVLLQKRLDPLIINAHDKWESQGGRIEYGESPEEALIRECREEIGCAVAVKKMLPIVLSRIWKRTDGDEQHVLVLNYELELLFGEPRSMDNKVGEVKWFSKNDVEKLDTLAGIKKIIATYL